MTAPETAFARFWAAVLLGAGLGLWYGFLRPLRPKHTTGADLMFLAGALWAWVYLSFGICGGDLRLGYLAGLLAGGFGWEAAAGRLLRRPFAAFWRYTGGIWQKICLPVKKILKKLKILFASAEKWVTIKWNNRRHNRRTSGGRNYGKIRKSLPRHQSGLPQQQSPAEGGGDCVYRVVYGGDDRTGLHHKRR